MHRGKNFAPHFAPHNGFSLLEVMVVTVIIGILVTLFLRYSEGVIEEAERAALNTISGSFANSMANLRGKWIVEGGSLQQAQPSKPVVMLDRQAIYLNEFGWPANTDPDEDSSSGTQTPEECLQLWRSIVQNPVPATLKPENRGRQRFHISTPQNHICRYELAYAEPDSHYFDYNLRNGGVNTHIDLPEMSN